MKTKRVLIIFLGLGLTALIFSGCENGNTEMRNMEQIYAEEGVPVKVEKVAPQSFQVWMEFNAVLTGIEESSAYAAIDDKVDKIYVTVGDPVKKDEVIVAFPTDSPSARYNQARVSFENAEASYKRMENLFSTGGISRQALDNARTAYEVARADWESVQKSVEVQAPISGTVTRINVRESDNVRKDDELFTVARTDKMKTTIWVSDKQISDFKVGATATAVWNDIVLSGSVVRVDMSMDQSRQAFGVVAEFDNPGLKVKGGVTAGISVESYHRSDAFVTERKNILRDDAGSFVYVVSGVTSVQRRVSVGRASGLQVEILDGLKAGDYLITEGQMHLTDGKKIKIIDQAGMTTASR